MQLITNTITFFEDLFKAFREYAPHQYNTHNEKEAIPALTVILLSLTLTLAIKASVDLFFDYLMPPVEHDAVNPYVNFHGIYEEEHSEVSNLGNGIEINDSLECAPAA